MSSVGKQLATFVAVLAALFTVGAIAGQVIDPDARGGDEMPGHGAQQSHEEDSKMTSASAHGGTVSRRPWRSGSSATTARSCATST
jgi:hypothetical protein